MKNIEDIDLKLLRCLQRDSSLTLEQISEAVNLSATSCMRRIKKLETAGRILRYRAVLDDNQVGFPVTAIFNVILESDTLELGQALARICENNTEIQSCYIASGEVDVIMVAKFRDVEEYKNFTYDFIEKMDGVNIAKYSSQIAVKTVSEDYIIPI